MRKCYFLTIFLFLFLFGLNNQSLADNLPPTVISPTNNGTTITGGGGGDGSGTFLYYELNRLRQGPHQVKILPKQFVNKLKSLKKAHRVKQLPNGKYPAYKYEVVHKKATGYLYRFLCPRNGGLRKSCPKWTNSTKLRTNSEIKAYYKIHPLKRNMLRSRRPSENIVSAFNVRIWRGSVNDKNFKLIFQRSLFNPNPAQRKSMSKNGAQEVSTTAPWWPGQSAWFNKKANQDWWNGYNGIYYKKTNKNSSPFAGAISYPNPPKRGSGCQNNIFKNNVNGKRNKLGILNGSGKKVKSRLTSKNMLKSLQNSSSWCYWEGEDIGKAYYPSQFGKGPEGTIKDSSGKYPKGLKEAILMKWNFAKYEPKKASPRLKVSIEGVPNRFYITQVIATDSRQKIMSQDIDVSISSATAEKGDEPCEIINGINPCDFSNSPPNVEAKIIAETPLQVRQTSNQAVALENINGIQLDQFQSVLPIYTSLSHYTPQLNFNKNIDQYLDFPGNITEIPTGYNPAYRPTPNIENKYNLEDLAKTNFRQVKNPAYLNQSGDSNSLSEPDFIFEKKHNLTWKEPTLENPCRIGGSWTANNPQIQSLFPLQWPEDLSKCEFPSPYPESNPGDGSQGSDPFEIDLYEGFKKWLEDNVLNVGGPVINAWDDALSAGASWEGQYVSGVKNENQEAFTPGLVRDALLRCYSGPLTSKYRERSIEGQTAYLKEKSQLLEECEGVPGNSSYIPVVPDPDSNTYLAQGSVVLAADRNTNNAALMPRLDTKPAASDMAIRVYPRDNPENLIEGETENGRAYFCTQGLPSNSNYYTSSGWKRSQNGTGDDNCRGFAVKWEWDDEQCRAGGRPSLSEIRTENAQTLPLSRYDKNLGEYTNAGIGKNFGNIQSNTAPYRGLHPIRNFEAALKNCQTDSGASGYKTKGSWQVSEPAQPGWGEGNTGPRINLGTDNYQNYVIEYEVEMPEELSNPNCKEEAPACWKMLATYSGSPNLIWSTFREEVNPWDVLDTSSGTLSNRDDAFAPPSNLAYIKVYGSKTSR